jgi:hypothetical protein
MKPVIVHPQNVPERACLIDLDSVISSTDPRSTAKGKRCHIALRAIDIRHLRAGSLEEIDGRIFPCPTQHVAWERMVVNNPMSRGIFPDAADALLSMPLLRPDLDIVKSHAKLGNAPVGWDQWRFLVAWGWSEWQTLHIHGEKWTLERRWEALRLVGYPHTQAAFRKMCAELGLSVTKSRPNR